MPEIIEPKDYQNKLYTNYNLKANFSNVICIKQPTKIIEKKIEIKEKIIPGLPIELLSIFLLSKKENERELQYKIDGSIYNKSLTSIENSRNKLGEILIGIELNENILTQNITFLNSQNLTVKGPYLKKGSVECLLKAFDAYKKYVLCREKNKMSLRQLISYINQDKSQNGRQNLMTMVNLILLSKVQVESSRGDTLEFAFSKLFKIESFESDEKEAIRLLIREARLKNENKGQKDDKVTLKSGKLMSICNKLYVNFNDSAFEKLLNNHTKIDKNGNVKFLGSHFKYPVGIKPSAARLCAILDCYKNYIQKQGETLEINTISKTFSMESILGICGQESEYKKNPKRFEEICKIAASYFGSISYNKFNFSIVYGSFKAAEQNGEFETQNQNKMGTEAEQNGEVVESYSDKSCISRSIVNKKVLYKKENTSSSKILNTEKSNTNKMSFRNTSDLINRNEVLLNLNDLSYDVYSYIKTLNPLIRSKELARLRMLNSIDKYEYEIKSLSVFQKFQKNLNERKIA